MCTFAPQISMNMQENNYIIEVNSVSKFFGDKTALDNVTFRRLRKVKSEYRERK